MILTQEQKDIIKSVKTQDKIKINAYAGTGKTTILIEIAKAYPDKKILYMVFNKSIKEEVSKKASQNLVVKTFHQIAYQYVVGNGNKKILNNKDLIDFIQSTLDISKISNCILLSKVFSAFCLHDFKEPDIENIKYVITKDKTLEALAFSTYARFKKSKYSSKTEIIDNKSIELNEKNKKSEIDFYTITKQIRSIFNTMERMDTVYTHDAYLKIFEKNINKFNPFINYDAIVIDEAQDLNPVMISIYEKINIKQKILVGDKHQSVYSWRNAVNSLSKINDHKEFYLTTSFRFHNKEVIELANNFLKNWKKETKFINSIAGNLNGKKAYLTRTNAKIINRIMKDKSEAKIFIHGKKALIDNIKNGNKIKQFYETMDESNLYGLNEYIKTLLRNYNYAEYKENANSFKIFMNMFLENLLLEEYFALDVLNEYSYENIINTIEKRHSEDSDMIYITAHSSKGLDFDDVEISEDFISITDLIISYVYKKYKDKEELNNMRTIIKIIQEILDGIQNNDDKYLFFIDELNLRYVAITRTIKNIYGAGYELIKKDFHNFHQQENLTKISNKIFEKQINQKVLLLKE